MSQQVRFAPSSLDVVYVRNGHVTVNRADGSEVVCSPGHHPAWEDALAVVFCTEDGKVERAFSDDGVFGGWLDIPAGNTLTAASGKVAVHRTDPRRVLCSWGEEFSGATDPVLSADGVWLAFLMPDWLAPNTATVVLRRTDDGQGRSERWLYTGAPLRPRFSHSGTSLTWEEAGGQIFGIADVANPSSLVVRLSRPGDSLTHPVPLWVPERGELFVAAVQASGGDAGGLFLIEWGSAAAGTPLAYYIGEASGSGFDWDNKSESVEPLCAYSTWVAHDGSLHRGGAWLDLPRTALPLPPTPPVVVPPEPDPERWTLVPDGTLVTDAIETLVGANPVQQDGIICLHKNTFPECEWRRVDGPQLLHWADASRFPGDRGWWIDGAPVWCLDTFASGLSVSAIQRTLVDFHHGTTNRWTQKNTLYGIVGGGVMVQFDPRFEGQYTDMSLQGTDQWAPAGYEKQWTRHDGWSRWDYIVTPLTAKGVIPWGDPSMDVVIQTVESAPTTPGEPLPFVPCPRPLTATPKPPEPPTGDDMTHDDIRRYAAEMQDTPLFGALTRYHNEVLPRDRPVAPCQTAEGGEFNTADVTTGGANGYFVRTFVSEYLIARDKGRTAEQAIGDGYDAAFKAYTNVVNPPPTPPTPPAGPFRGPISAEGRDFVAPEPS